MADDDNDSINVMVAGKAMGTMKGLLGASKGGAADDDQSLLDEFRDFLTTGDLMSIAVAFIMAKAIADLIGSFIDNIFTGAFTLLLPPDKTDFSKITLFGEKLKVGNFINSMISFVALAFVVFLIVKGYKRMTQRAIAQEGPSDTDILIQIRDLLTAIAPAIPPSPQPMPQPGAAMPPRDREAAPAGVTTERDQAPIPVNA